MPKEIKITKEQYESLIQLRAFLDGLQSASNSGGMGFSDKIRIPANYTSGINGIVKGYQHTDTTTSGVK